MTDKGVLMRAVHSPHEEPIPGYRLLEPLGRGGFGEVWKCEAPGGMHKAIKFVHGGLDLTNPDGNGAEQELRSLQHIKSIRHPFLLSVERAELIDGDLVLVTELADRSLHDLLEERRRQGRAGLDRAELLGYLRETAEVLDLMNQEHGLQHLDVKPRNLFLVGRHVKVGDFGLVNSLAEIHSPGDGAGLGGLTPLYAAPETLEGKATLYTDQYSLAVTYHELLTGEQPFQARSAEHLILLITSTPPDLSRLPPADRDAVARAMDKDPRQRFRCCLDFIEALEAATPVPAPPPRAHATAVVRTLSGARAALEGGDVTLTAVVPTCTQWVSGQNAAGTPVPHPPPPVEVAELPQGDGLLPGYQLLENLGRGPTGEVWRARGPRGDARIVRFLSPVHFPNAQPASALDRLLALQHDNLPALQVLPAGADRVALISEAGERTLRSRLEECQSSPTSGRSRGAQGIPRLELLAHLGRAAEALDDLRQRHRLRHLALNPRCLAVSRGRLLLLDFALAELLWLPAGLQPAALNPRYAAPELFQAPPSRDARAPDAWGDASDQYSLALLYQELLLGVHPFRNLNARQMASPKLRGQPDLSFLPAGDRPAVLRALHAEPGQRFPTCLEFILALQEATREPDRPHSPGTTTASLASGLHRTVAAAPAPPVWKPAVEGLVAAAARGHEIRSAGGVAYRLTPGSHVEHRCWARLPPGMAMLKLDGFREQWRAKPLARLGNERFLLSFQGAGSLLQGWLGRTPGLVVEIVVGAPRDPDSHLVPVRVTLQPAPGNKAGGAALLADLAPQLLASLQTYLHSQCDRAGQERFPLDLPVRVQPPGQSPPLAATLRDLGRTGLCLYSQQRLPPGPATFVLTPPAPTPPVQIPGWVRDCVADQSGRFEVEADFT
jgi:serine/threonine protein kinase